MVLVAVFNQKILMRYKVLRFLVDLEILQSIQFVDVTTKLILIEIMHISMGSLIGKTMVVSHALIVMSLILLLI